MYVYYYEAGPGVEPGRRGVPSQLFCRQRGAPAPNTGLTITAIAMAVIIYYLLPSISTNASIRVLSCPASS